MDHFGPLLDAENFKYILVIIDAFTRFTWLFVTKSTETREVIENLNLILNTYGNPEEIVSDRGTAFTAKEFEDFPKEKNIRHRKVAVAAPWANGIVERMNRFIKSSLTKLITKANEWRKELGTLQYIINIYHSAVKASPSQLLLGYHQRSHTDHALVRHAKLLADIDVKLQVERENMRDNAIRATN